MVTRQVRGPPYQSQERDPQENGETVRTISRSYLDCTQRRVNARTLLKNILESVCLAASSGRCTNVYLKVYTMLLPVDDVQMYT